MASSVVISAPNAVLGIPRDVWGINSGVTEAADSTCSCTGWTFAHGDGVNKVFELPSLVSSLTALYRRDWQGNMALSANPRTNYAIQSQNLNAWTKINTPSITSGAITLGTLSLDLVGDTSAETRAEFRQAVVLATPGAKKFTIRVKKGATASPATYISLYESTADAYRVSAIITWVGSIPSITLGGIGTLDSQTDIGGGIWELRITTAAIASVSNILTFYVYLASGGVSYTGDIYIGGFQLADAYGSYIPTTTAPVTVTDYAATGNTITLAEAPLLGSDLSVDADLVPHSFLSFNHGGRR